MGVNYLSSLGYNVRLVTKLQVTARDFNTILHVSTDLQFTYLMYLPPCYAIVAPHNIESVKERGRCKLLMTKIIVTAIYIF